MKQNACMYIPKRYDQSKTYKCPFCDKEAIFQNKQKIPTCKEHKDRQLEDIKCICGSALDMREGKYGIFFTCINCGALNLKKVLEINNSKKMQKNYKIQDQKRNQNSETEKEERVVEKKTTQIKPKTLQEIEQEMRKGNEQIIRSDELDFI